jgi:hypothetical protein
MREIVGYGEFGICCNDECLLKFLRAHGLPKVPDVPFLHGPKDLVTNGRMWVCKRWLWVVEHIMGLAAVLSMSSQHGLS